MGRRRANDLRRLARIADHQPLAHRHARDVDPAVASDDDVLATVVARQPERNLAADDVGLRLARRVDMDAEFGVCAARSALRVRMKKSGEGKERGAAGPAGAAEAGDRPRRSPARAAVPAIAAVSPSDGDF